MDKGKGLALLLAEILSTIEVATGYQVLQPYAKILNEKLQLTQKVLDKLMPHAMKGDFEKYLADANIFMEFFSLVIMGWIWLDIAMNAQENLQKSSLKFPENFYIGKIETMKYFYSYELPKTSGHAEILMNPTTVTIKKDKEFIN
jgi:butyryl-CoA dehydrogenase